MRLQRSLYLFSGKFKGILFIALVLFILGLLYYTQVLVQGLRADARKIVEFNARFYQIAASKEGSEEELNFIFDKIIKQSVFPIIITDSERIPMAWQGIPVDPNDKSPEAIKKVTRIMRSMGRESEPVPITYEDLTLHYLYYGDSKRVVQLLYLPYIEAGLILMFALVSIFGFTSITRSEQRFIWVGMAKETAHQLGTPLSSLMGWLEVLKSSASLERANQVAIEMRNDIARLEKVAARFSQIGSKTDLKEQNIAPVLHGVVEYFHRRLPQMGNEVKLIENYQEVPPVPINKDLFEWAVENLIKNALDALQRRPDGRIEISVGRDLNSKRIFIDLKDNGIGIDPKIRRDIFKAGYSTKKRGWGLGLNLAKRIIEEYHHGYLVIKESRVGKGTTMRILL